MGLLYFVHDSLYLSDEVYVDSTENVRKFFIGLVHEEKFPSDGLDLPQRHAIYLVTKGMFYK